ncbi:metacaspase-2-like [Galleria mellonella]|uniref:Metacaspase-2-like n=1 Tax=Galleria mellonella TaxID=7137 RepID=A0A6J3BW89_GALME|nr:metacaspase-2-like [Galleria mellonella]
MSRCDYDVLFYRVFCLALLIIAFIFTVILTNVFIDIDGLLSRKGKGKLPNTNPLTEKTDISAVPDEIKSEILYNDDNHYEDNEYSDRTKRSSDSEDYLLHIKNPNVKSVLKNRLTMLLEELDTEETATDTNKKERVNENTSKSKDNTVNLLKENKDIREIDENTHGNMKIAESVNGKANQAKKPDEDIQIKIDKVEKTTKEFLRNVQNDDLLHLAMHNMLLQGIIEHMDLNNVFKKVHSLINNFNKLNSLNKEKLIKTQVKKTVTPNSKRQMNPGEENNYLKEMVNCSKVHNEITETIEGKNKEAVEERKNIPKKGSELLIKTIIDITSMNFDKNDKENQSNSKDVKGIVKVIYNGKPIKLSKLNSDEEKHFDFERKKIKRNLETSTIRLNKIQNNVTKSTPSKATIDNTKNTKFYLNKVIDAYFRRYIDKSSSKSIEAEHFFIPKRIKRRAKMQYEDKNMSNKQNSKKKADKKDVDELYVEIETHFDSKGMKGEKKKKLIKNLIDKIQKAIHSDVNQDTEKKKKHKHLHIKKRLQNPLDNKYESILINKAIGPLEAIVHRQLDPISKTAQAEGIVSKIYDKSGKSWKKSYIGPGFLTRTKSLNSAEMGQVDIDYNKVMDRNGIPQRIQKPLNTDVDKDMLNANYFDAGNMKFFIKDIDGSGFSIGFNQYTDEAPDTEAMKLFTGIEELIKIYHQNYDQTQITTEYINQNADQHYDNKYEYRNNELITSKINNENNDRHNIVRRSTKNNYQHSNEYKIIFDGNFLPYSNYQEIFGDQKRTIKTSFNKNYNVENHNDNLQNIKIMKNNNQIKPSSILLDEEIVDRNLKLTEILTLANLFERKKRAILLKKISNIKSKIKFFNTKAIPKRIILNAKRNKRQINKIRIIAQDDSSKLKQSAENIFVLSDENMLADRAVVTDVETPEELEVPSKVKEHLDYIPYINDQTNLDSSYGANEFYGKHRHNLLMSKYPHIFMEEINRPKENIEEPSFIEKLAENIPRVTKYNTKNIEVQSITENYIPTALEFPMSNIEQHNTVNPNDPKTNYKFTVKIMPKNQTGVPSTFKEIHTSINKSYNKNGLHYSTLVNVSEISKIEKLIKKTKENFLNTSSGLPDEKDMKQKEEKIKLILKKHKQRIDEQLDRLQKEKEHLESLIFKNDNNSSELVNLILPLTPPETARMRKDDVNEFAASTFLNIKDLQNDSKSTTEITTTILPVTTTTTTIATTKEPENTTVVYPDKNNNLTQEILKKIDRNTVMLQVFLQKLTEKLSLVTQATTIRTDKEVLNVPKDWKHYQPIHEPFFGQAMPEIEVRKNGTHVSIPFVYAYQQPFPSVNKPDGANPPVASVVYHGHIHTNAVSKNRETWKSNSRDVNTRKYANTVANRSRFFIDDLDNEYKVVAPKSVSKNDGVYSKLPIPINFNNTIIS